MFRNWLHNKKFSATSIFLAKLILKHVASATLTRNQPDLKFSPIQAAMLSGHEHTVDLLLRLGAKKVDWMGFDMDIFKAMLKRTPTKRISGVHTLTVPLSLVDVVRTNIRVFPHNLDLPGISLYSQDGVHNYWIFSQRSMLTSFILGLGRCQREGDAHEDVLGIIMWTD